MKRFIITFGQVHTHRINCYTFDKDSVAIIQAEDTNEAHHIAMDIFKGVFHQCVPEEYFDAEGFIKYFPRGKHPSNFKE